MSEPRINRLIFVAEVLDEDNDSVTLKVLRRDDVQVDVHEGQKFYTIVFTDPAVEQKILDGPNLQ